MLYLLLFKMLPSRCLEVFCSVCEWDICDQTINEIVCEDSTGLSLSNTQSSCYDLFNIGIASVACFIAIITCVFTILMFILVKRQLLGGDKNHRTLMTETSKHVEKIKDQILNTSLIKLMEKKQNLKSCCDSLFEFLCDHQNLLKEGPAVQKEKDLFPIVKDTDKEICSICEMISVFGVPDESLGNYKTQIVEDLQKLQVENVIASNFDEMGKWLDGFQENYSSFIEEINVAVNKIKETIKNQTNDHNI